jgi:hypothetical protein
MGLFVAAELWPGRAVAPQVAEAPAAGEPDCGVRVPRDPDLIVSSTGIPSTESLHRRRGGGDAPTQLLGIEPLAELPVLASKPGSRTRLSSMPVSQQRLLDDEAREPAEDAEPELELESSRAPRGGRDPQVFLVPRVEPDDVFSGNTMASEGPPRLASLPDKPVHDEVLELLPAEQPGQSTAFPSGGKNLSLQLQQIQQHLEQISQWQLSQSQQALKSDQLQQATQLVQQLQQQQLSHLEQELQQLRQTPPAPAPESPPAGSPESSEEPASDEIPAIPLTGLSEETASAAGPPDPQSAETTKVLKASPEGSGRYSFEMKDAPVTEVLELLGRLSGKNILAAPEISGTLTANLQRVELDEALAAILKARGYMQSREGDFVYIRPAREEQEPVAPLRPVTRVFHPNHLSAQELRALILPVLTRDIGQVSMTGTDRDVSTAENSSPVPAGNDVVVVRDYPAVLEQIDAILRETDVPPPQVSIEAIVL